ncbi:MAG TPA: tRNA pseudouridine(55) synthase TruB, partial [Gammaproteobacteria bacterium]|nr:tRNA pseudouridine(55) synthase TruB [Gammaproteobacteria bacterium]
MARSRRGQDISGFVLLDKPRGPTSNQALQRVRRLFDARKAGHTGTLDPLATGMLPICFGAATRTAALAIQASKLYETTGLLGVATDTGDAMGEVSQRAAIGGIQPADIAAATARFVGEIEQVPPRYSAVRHEGRRMYELARRGIEVEAAPRRVTIHEIRLRSVELPQFSLQVHCSKGTYIRTLVEDIAKSVGTVAHVTELRRTGVDPFLGAEMVTMEELERASSAQQRIERFLLPVDSVL